MQFGGIYWIMKRDDKIKNLMEDKNIVDKIRFTCEELYCGQPLTDSPQPLYDKLDEIIEMASSVRKNLEKEIENMSK